MKAYKIFFLMIGSLLLTTACTSITPQSFPKPLFSSNFASGSIGNIQMLDEQGKEWQLSMRNDNNNPSLPATYHSWWYVRIDQVPTDLPMRLLFDNFGFKTRFIPVYSYDQKNWHYFEEGETNWTPCTCTTLTQCRIEINKQFSQKTVWIARTYPYTPNDLQAFLAQYINHPSMQIETIGSSEKWSLPIQLITIGHRNDSLPKKHIWLQARSHPAETGPSFVLEGLISNLLTNDQLAKSLLSKYHFHIVPMHNIDGVVSGNYRTTPSSKNLEIEWRVPQEKPLALTVDSAQENQGLNARMLQLISRDEPVVLALNLHSSNSDPDTAAFFFPHFGSSAAYNTAERKLWDKQLSFICAVARHYDGRIEHPPQDAGHGFLNYAFPETWWWLNAKDSVNAITLETTYGKAGFDHWIKQDDLRQLGASLLKAIDEIDTDPEQIRSIPVCDKTVFRQPFKSSVYKDDDEND